VTATCESLSVGRQTAARADAAVGSGRDEMVALRIFCGMTEALVGSYLPAASSAYSRVPDKAPQGVVPFSAVPSPEEHLQLVWSGVFGGERVNELVTG